MEIMEIAQLEIFRNKKVFITGSTGFKGSWLCLLLQELGATVAGYGLSPNTNPNHFDLLKIQEDTYIADILTFDKLTEAIQHVQPEIIFHLAAQALVRTSYKEPIYTYQTNVIGTLNLLEAAKNCPSVKAIVLITTDKVYENKENELPYKETDELGGYDMYSSSKACCEILIKSYRNSFINVENYKREHHILIASARAGNVIGGGDWSADRLIPDIVKATSQGKEVAIRNPNSVRPWQHVLDCLYGYLLLGAKLLEENKAFSGPWNFSPNSSEIKNVQEIAAIAKQSWNEIDIVFGTQEENYHEAGLLVLDNTKSSNILQWKPVWNTTEAIQNTIDWYKEFYLNKQVITKIQIANYLKQISTQ